MGKKWLWVAVWAVVVVGVLGAVRPGVRWLIQKGWRGSPLWSGFLRETELTDVSSRTGLAFPDSAVLVCAYQYGGADIFYFYTVTMRRIDIEEFIDQEPDNNEWSISRYKGQEADELAQKWLNTANYSLPEDLWEGRVPTGEECYALHLQSVNGNDPWVLAYICSDDSEFSAVYILLVT